MKRTREEVANNSVRIFTEEHRKELIENGFVIVRGVLPRDVCERVGNAMIEYMHTYEPELAKLPCSQWSRKLRPPGPHGLNQFDGHQQFLWDVRQHPRVVQAFCELMANANPRTCSPRSTGSASFRPARAT